MSSRKAQQSLESIRTRSRAVAASADYRSVDTCSLLIACRVWHRSETETSEAKTPIPSSMAVELFDGTTWYVVHPTRKSETLAVSCPGMHGMHGISQLV